MSTPQVSVIIPVYNAEAWLNESVDSALQQQVPLEVIAVDDGSSDGSAAVLESYGSRIRVIRQLNAGVAQARNTGIAAACGQWIAFLDADDIWEPDKLSRQLQLAADEGTDIVYSNSRNFGQPAHVGELRLPPQALPAGDVFEALLMDNFVTLSSLVIRRQVLAGSQTFQQDLNGVEDWDLLLRLSAAGARVSVVRDSLVRYRWQSTSLSKRHFDMQTRRLRVVQTALQTQRGRRLSHLMHRQVVANCFCCSAWFVAPQSAIAAVQWYLQSLYNWPLNRTAWRGLARTCLGRL